MVMALALCAGAVFACFLSSSLTPVSNFYGFVALYISLWVIAVTLVVLFPRRLSVGGSVALIVLASAVARLALLPYPPSDDMNRYLWEGRLVSSGISPYAHAPDDPALSDMAAGDPYHAKVNHPSMPAAYPPLMIGIFSGLVQIWYDPLAVKVFVTLFDLAAVLFLLGILHARGLPLRWAWLYALNPLVLFAFAGEGHFDAVQAALLMGALFFHTRRKWVWAFLLAGLAIQVKYVAVFAVPFLINRENWRSAWVMAVAAVTPYLPMLLLDSRQLFYCLFAFGSDFALNGPIHGALWRLTGSMEFATVLVKGAFVAAFGFAAVRLHPWWRRSLNNDPLPGMIFVLSALLLLSPTVHYWYLSWILPLAVICPGYGWILASLTSVAYFSVCRKFSETGVWALPESAFFIEWLAVLAVLAWEGVFAVCRLKQSRVVSAPQTISVIVPALNEGDRIAACCEALLASDAVMEVLVSAGESQDNTVTEAQRAGARVVECGSGGKLKRGRGIQIDAGLQQASGDVAVIVHADIQVPPESWSRILEMLQKNPNVIGGSLGSCFEGGGLSLCAVGLLNDIRAGLFSIAFGDQLQFFRLAPVMERSLFPAIPLMEDVELSIRLYGVGRTVHLFGGAQVSMRGWHQKRLPRAILIIRLFGSYLFKRLWGPVDTEAMYRRYYQPSGDYTALDSD